RAVGHAELRPHHQPRGPGPVQPAGRRLSGPGRFRSLANTRPARNGSIHHRNEVSAPRRIRAESWAESWRVMLTRSFLLLLCALALSGCGSVLTASTADVAGITGAGVASAVTKSPAAAAGIGFWVAAGARAGLQQVQ